MRVMRLEYIRRFTDYIYGYTHIRFKNSMMTLCDRHIVAYAPSEPSKDHPLCPKCDRERKRLLEDPSNLIKWS